MLDNISTMDQIPMKLLIFFLSNRNVHCVSSNLTIFFYKVDCRVATNLPGYISIGDQKPMKVRNTLLREKLTLWNFILFISTLNMDPVSEKVLN